MSQSLFKEVKHVRCIFNQIQSKWTLLGLADGGKLWLIFAIKPCLTALKCPQNRLGSLDRNNEIVLLQ